MFTDMCTYGHRTGMCIYSHKLRATEILAIYSHKLLRATRDICDCSRTLIVHRNGVLTWGIFCVRELQKKSQGSLKTTIALMLN